MKYIMAVILLLAVAGTAGAQVVNSNNPADVPLINAIQNAKIKALEKQARKNKPTVWFVTTDGSLRIRKDKIVGCRAVEVNDVWGFKISEATQKEMNIRQGVAPGSVLVGHAVEVYFANEWWQVKKYLVPESQWHRHDKDGQRMRPEKKETIKTRQAAYEWMAERCR